MKTAVEFYREELNALVSLRETKFKTEHEIFEQAKEMEKEQIKNAFHKNSQKFFCEEEAEQYYNETFNNKNNETRKRSWVL